MPELPEVETYVQDLAPMLTGRRVATAEIFWPRILAAPTADVFIQQILGQEFVSFGRRGKYLLLGMARPGGDARQTLIVHLRMTGHLFVHPAMVTPGKHTHAVLGLDDGRRLHYQDARKFGRLWLVDDPQAVLATLGPEPLDSEFTADVMVQHLAGRKAAVKSLLLDQKVVAGVGNIYADEALFLAGIHPERRGADLTTDEVARLCDAIRTVLTTAIAQQGSTLGKSSVQNYLRPNGQWGNFQEEHNVYQRTGQACRQCGATIMRRVIAQRSAHYCPACQPPLNPPQTGGD
jgi:formamidopyrimidine-DNA glycosylase